MRQSESLLVLAAGAVGVVAHQGCGGQEIARRNLGMMDVGVGGLYVANGSTGRSALYSTLTLFDLSFPFPTLACRLPFHIASYT